MPVTMASYVTNSCLTGVGIPLDASTTIQFRVFGFTGCVHTCVDFAIDGYTIWGHPLVYQIDDDASKAVMKINATDNNTLTNVELFGLAPYAGAEGDTAGSVKAVNQGQVRAIVEIVTTSALWHCAILCAGEYFIESGVLCFPGAHNSVIDDTTSIIKAAANEFTIGTYGAIWNGYAYRSAQTTSATIVSQAPDHMMFVGTKAGKGSVTRFTWAGGINTAETGTSTLSTVTTNFSTYTAMSIIFLEPPTSGMAQFKGLTTSTEQKYYV